MTAVEIDAAQEWRLNLIRDAMNGLPYYLPREDVIFLPFLDCVSLLHQRRVVYALWRKASDRSIECGRVFLRDPTFLARFSGRGSQRNTYFELRKLASYLTNRATTDSDWIPVAGDWTSGAIIELPAPETASERFGISIHALGTVKEFLDKSRAVLDIDREATKQVRRLLHQESSMPLLSTSFRAALHHAALCHCQVQRPRRRDSTHFACARMQLSSDELDYFLAPMTEALNEIVKDIGSIAGDLKIEKSGMPNLFAVARIFSFSEEQFRYKGQFDYTCRFMLLEKARHWIEQRCSKGDIDPLLIDQLQTPLPHYKRSVADHVFSNETVTFKLDPDGGGLSDVESVGDIQRNDAKPWLESIPAIEREMYPDNADIFYIPVHVSLVPWITIYTLYGREDRATGDDAKRWYHNYLFYRQVVQRVAAQIRSKAASVYADLFARSILFGLQDVHRDPNTVADTINVRLRQLAQIYPFPMGRITLDGRQHQCLSMGKQGRFFLELKSNPFFGTKIGDSDVRLKDLLTYCQDRVDAFVEREMRVVSRGVADATHLLKNHLEKLRVLARETGNEEIQALASNLLLLHKIAEARLNPEKRCELLEKRDHSISSEQFMALVQQEYNNVLNLLNHSTYTNNVHERFRKLDALLKMVPVEFRLTSRRLVSYYGFLLPVVLEGLVSNAVVNLSIENPFLTITVDNAGNNVLLTVSNSVEPSIDIRTMLAALNNPGADFVGVNQLHWVADVFWNSPPVWTEQRLSGTSCICATIPIGVLE